MIISKRGYWSAPSDKPLPLWSRILVLSPLGWGFWVLALGMAFWEAVKAFADVIADSCDVWWRMVRGR